MQFDFSVSGDVQISRKLMRFQEHIQDANPVFRSLADDFMRWEKEQFSSEGRRASGRWAPLAPSTLAQKRAGGYPSTILLRTGELKKSLTSRGGANRLVLSATWMLFGSEVEYMGFHQTGTSRMPQRRPLEFTAKDRKEVMRKIQRFLVTGLAP